MRAANARPVSLLQNIQQQLADRLPWRTPSANAQPHPTLWAAKQKAITLGLDLVEQPLPAQIPEAIELLKSTGMDLGHCARLCNRFLSPESAITNPLTLLLITPHDQIQPVMGVMLFDHTDAQLLGLAINQKYQKQGLGSFLLAAGIAYLQAHLDKNVILRFSTDDARQTAINLYQRAGARIVPPSSDPFDFGDFELTAEDLLPEPRATQPRTIEMILPTQSQPCRAFLKRHLETATS